MEQKPIAGQGPLAPPDSETASQYLAAAQAVVERRDRAVDRRALARLEIGNAVVTAAYLVAFALVLRRGDVLASQIVLFTFLVWGQLSSGMAQRTGLQWRMTRSRLPFLLGGGAVLIGALVVFGFAALDTRLPGRGTPSRRRGARRHRGARSRAAPPSVERLAPFPPGSRRSYGHTSLGHRPGRHRDRSADHAGGIAGRCAAKRDLAARDALPGGVDSGLDLGGRAAGDRRVVAVAACARLLARRVRSGGTRLGCGSARRCGAGRSLGWGCRDRVLRGSHLHPGACGT